MNVSEAEALLRELAPLAVDWVTEVGMRGRPPHNYAYLQISSPSDPSNFAIVSTPGDGWFELSVSGGYSTGDAGDLFSDADVREILEPYVSQALRFLNGEWTERRSRVFKFPYIVLDADDGPVKLRLSVSETMKRVLGR